ncbi:hypothetical protein [Nafulsella turpanensis]|uniref:hypothetical protein n=1 Tax=Nafulsella turpanensis TaxID=1265690 RepID=UPI00036F6779|nr:hypothetical protein [Nafulsella turpanensis]
MNLDAHRYTSYHYSGLVLSGSLMAWRCFSEALQAFQGGPTSCTTYTRGMLLTYQLHQIAGKRHSLE